MRILILFIHAFAGWLLCGAIMGIGMALTTLEITLVVHAIAVPFVFTAISLNYFRKPDSGTPLGTAAAFLALVIFLDVTVVALLIEGNLGMFKSLLGTWIPFLFIFLSTYIVGRLVKRP